MCFNPFSAPGVAAPPPVTVPTRDTDAVLAQSDFERRRAQRAQGFASTILTGPASAGASVGSIGTKTLLGT